MTGRPEAIAVAFGGRPDAGVRVGAGDHPPDRWLAAVALGGQGHYAAAAALLRELLTAPAVPPAVAAHAAVTLAAHRRQLGGHAAARPYDALGLRIASAAPPGRADDAGTDAAAARADALIGLAADALGLGAAPTAARLLDVAAEAVREHPSWRPAARLGWVRAELALLRGDAAAAVEPARRARELSTAAGSVRHVLKSRIVDAVARSAAGEDPLTVLSDLDAAAAAAERTGLLPLVWPARFAAADVLARAPGGASPANERAARMAQRSANGLVSDAARRRHAGIATLSVILTRCDSLGRRLMREGFGPDARLPVM